MVWETVYIWQTELLFFATGMGVGWVGGYLCAYYLVKKLLKKLGYWQKIKKF